WPANEPALHTAEYYFVPVGLRLEQARRVIREAGDDNEVSPVRLADNGNDALQRWPCTSMPPRPAPKRYRDNASRATA
ncbi:MAG TPA: hypothetical protein VK821_06150, partial [Dehalococcoidia bacterium]|nr:hypothetical protein [Dehalococcoidia bacterium]